MSNMNSKTPKPSLYAVGASGRRTRATSLIDAADAPPVWSGGEVVPDGVGLYRRFTLGAAERGWRLQPTEIEKLLDIYVAYVRRAEEATTERCLRVFKNLQRRAR
jgi:hypothetical protein